MAIGYYGNSLLRNTFIIGEYLEPPTLMLKLLLFRERMFCRSNFNTYNIKLDSGTLHETIKNKAPT